MGARIDFEVVGVYQSINNTGEGFRIRLEAVRLANPLWMPVEYGLKLGGAGSRNISSHLPKRVSAK